MSTPAPVITIPAVLGDGSLAPIEKMEAHRRGQLHLAVSVFLFDATRRLLIQRRAAGKYHCPGQWANTCCTHPHWGEAPARAAERRLDEELGIRGIALEERRTVDYRAEVGNGLIEHERVSMYTRTVDAEALRHALNPDEVDAIAWVTPAELARMRADEPDALTPWFRIYFDRFPDLQI